MAVKTEPGLQTRVAYKKAPPNGGAFLYFQLFLSQYASDQARETSHATQYVFSLSFSVPQLAHLHLRSSFLTSVSFLFFALFCEFSAIFLIVLMLSAMSPYAYSINPLNQIKKQPITITDTASNIAIPPKSLYSITLTIIARTIHISIMNTTLIFTHSFMLFPAFLYILIVPFQIHNINVPH